MGNSPADGIRVGVAAVPITPPDAEFLAGGLPYRNWLIVHDAIWARAIVLEQGSHRVALVSVDLIGLYYDDVVQARTRIADRLPVDYVLVAATHTHNAPDTLGAWSPQIGCDIGDYRRLVIEKIADAVTSAANSAAPAKLRYFHGPAGEPRLSKDTRPPKRIDDTLTVWQALRQDSGAAIVTVVHFAAHPILIPSLNWDISSDFVHYLRQYVERGGDGDDGPIASAGGVCVFFNGALGGRITPANVTPLKRGRVRDLGHDASQAYGYRLANRALSKLRAEGVDLADDVALETRSRKIEVELTNPLLRIGTQTCAFDRFIREGRVPSEVAIIRLGPLQFFAVPGMLFPESLTGEFTALPGSDFPDAAAEPYSLRQLAGDRSIVVIGLANDMLGYLIPRALWDERPPYTTPDNRAPYGELISPGPAAVEQIVEGLASLSQNPE